MKKALLFLLMVYGSLSPPAFAQNDAMRDALARLAEVEGEIARVRERQQTEEERLFQARKSLDAAGERLEGSQQEGAATRGFLEEYQRDRGEQLGSVAEQIQAENLAESQSRHAARRAAALMAFEAQRAEPSLSSLASLAILEQKHEQRRRVAAQRALRLMGDRADVEGELANAARTARHYSAFASYSIDQLRDKQQTLADEIQKLQQDYEMQTEQVGRLAAQRAELSELIGRLSAGSDRGAASQPTQAAAPPGQVEEAPAVANEDAEVPSVNLEAAEEAAAGPRQLFWHATPVAVRSLGAGRVAFSGSFAGYRHLLIIDMGGGWHALYGNMTRGDAAIGTSVSAGNRLGVYQAAQGERAEPFWFEVRRGTDPVMPGEWPGLPADWKAKLFTKAN